jgi:hypothetical protein
MDGRTDRVIPIYPPNFVCRGYNNYKPLNVFYYCFIIYMGTNNAVTTFEPVNNNDHFNGISHYLQMCLKKYGCCPKFGRGDNSTCTFTKRRRACTL